VEQPILRSSDIVLGSLEGISSTDNLQKQQQTVRRQLILEKQEVESIRDNLRSSLAKIERLEATDKMLEEKIAFETTNERVVMNLRDMIPVKGDDNFSRATGRLGSLTQNLAPALAEFKGTEEEKNIKFWELFDKRIIYVPGTIYQQNFWVKQF
jgi:hypothetical protein